MTLKEKFSEENIKKQIIGLIEKKFGTDHKIKLAILKSGARYNDEGYDYSPALMLIDENFNEIDHDIKTWVVFPDEDESYEYFEETNEDFYFDQITIKF